MKVPSVMSFGIYLSPSHCPNSLSSFRPSAIPDLHPAAGEFHAYHFSVLCARRCLQVPWAPSCKEGPSGAMSPNCLDAQILALWGGTFPLSLGSPFPHFCRLQYSMRLRRRERPACLGTTFAPLGLETSPTTSLSAAAHHCTSA